MNYGDGVCQTGGGTRGNGYSVKAERLLFLWSNVCRQIDANRETGCMEFDIEKGRFAFCLTAPYSEERRETARRFARENNAAGRLK